MTDVSFGLDLSEQESKQDVILKTKKNKQPKTPLPAPTDDELEEMLFDLVYSIY